MSNKISVLFFVAMIVFTPINVFAQTSTATPATTITTTPTTTIKDKMTTTRQASKDAMVAAKEAFKEKLKAIKDEKKKAIVERIDSKIASINEMRTTHFSQHLAKLTGVIDRISSREATLKTEGKDTTKLMAAIVTAKSAISKAQAVNDAQKSKTYTASITTDELLKSAVGATLSQFQADLKAVFNLVKAARAAVHAASLEIKNLSVPKSNNTSTITPSVSPTASQ